MSHYLKLRILKRFAAANLRTALGRESLAPIEKFIMDGYTEKLFEDFQFLDGDSVLVLGGYLGDSVRKWLRFPQINVVVVEPVNEYFEELQKSFGSNSRVTLFNVAVGGRNGEIDIFIDGLESGFRAKGAHSQKAKIVKFEEFLSGLHQTPAVIELNIEGGEYEVLQNLIEYDLLKSIKTLLVQFHRSSIEDEVLRANSRLALSITHSEAFCYDWVWERWDRIDEANN